MNIDKIERGWFYLADLNPRRGTEPGKTRPVLVIQTDLLNDVGHPSTVILPITSNIKDDAEPLRVRIPGNSDGFTVESDIMIDQIRAIDNRRLYKLKSNHLIKKIASVSPAILQKVVNSLKLLCEI